MMHIYIDSSGLGHSEDQISSPITVLFSNRKISRPLIQSQYSYSIIVLLSKHSLLIESVTAQYPRPQQGSDRNFFAAFLLAGGKYCDFFVKPPGTYRNLFALLAGGS
eukprot:12408616-Karenia_brevis.AAC.1